MATTFAESAFAELDKFKTPDFPKENFGDWEFQDADDELRHIAEYIKKKTPHNSNIEPERIKYLYTRSAKKDAGRYVAGFLVARPNIEKMANDDFDYFLAVYHPVWKALDSKQKAIQMDKLLCGIDIKEGKDPAELVFAKKATDTREYKENMNHFGIEEVIKSSEIIDLACSSAIEKEKEEAKNAKKKTPVDANSLDENEG